MAKLPVGARPTGLGGAFVGLADDANSLHWNPAGLESVRLPELSVLHTEYLADITYQSLGYAHPAGGAGTFAAALNVLNYGRIQRTIEDEYGLYVVEESPVYTSPRDLYGSLGWGLRLFGPLRAGFAVRMTFQQLTGNTLTGIGAGAGLLWDTPVRGLRLGAVVDNAGTLTTVGRSLPMSVAAGASYGVGLGRNFRMVYAADARLPVDAAMEANLGAEIVAFEMVSLRVGARAGGMLGGPTLGLGFAYPMTWFGSAMRVKFDYASVASGELGNSHRFQVSVVFGATAPSVQLGRLQASREDGELVLKWKGRGPAYHVYAWKEGWEYFELLTDRPVETPYYPISDLAPGRYVFRVVSVDPQRIDWQGPVSPDITVTIEPPPGADHP